MTDDFKGKALSYQEPIAAHVGQKVTFGTVCLSSTAGLK